MIKKKKTVLSKALNWKQICRCRSRGSNSEHKSKHNISWNHWTQWHTHFVTLLESHTNSKIFFCNKACVSSQSFRISYTFHIHSTLFIIIKSGFDYAKCQSLTCIIGLNELKDRPYWSLVSTDAAWLNSHFADKFTLVYLLFRDPKTLPSIACLSRYSRSYL